MTKFRAVESIVCSCGRAWPPHALDVDGTVFKAHPQDGGLVNYTCPSCKNVHALPINVVEEAP